MEKKHLGQILSAFAVLGLMVSSLSGFYYYGKIQGIKQEMDSNLDTFYSMQGLVLKADKEFGVIHEGMLSVLENADPMLETIDRFLSTIKILSALGVADAQVLEKNRSALKDLRDSVASSKSDIDSFRKNLSEFKEFLDNLSRLKEKVEDSAREAEIIIIMTTVYLCILNLALFWLGWRMASGEGG